MQDRKPSQRKWLLTPDGTCRGEVCRALHRASAEATENNQRLHLIAPYFNGSPCPLLQSESKYFSHEVRPCTPPPIVEKINHHLNLEIREVKFGMSMLARNQGRTLSNESGILRIISPLRKRKGTISFWGFGVDGMEVQIELQRRSLTKEDQKNLLSLQRGDIIEQISNKGNTDTRIRLENFDEIRPLFIPRWEKTS